MRIYRIFMVLLIYLVVSTASAQKVSYPYPEDSSIIRINDLYIGYGKIFTSKSEAHRDYFGIELPGPLIIEYYRDLKLKVAEIMLAESLLFEKYNQAYAQDERVTGYISIAEPQKHLKYYYRQYVGCKNEKGESLVLVNLMNFRNKKKGKHYFDFWTKYFCVGHGDFYEKNQKLLLINITKKEVILP